MSSIVPYSEEYHFYNKMWFGEVKEHDLFLVLVSLPHQEYSSVKVTVGNNAHRLPVTKIEVDENYSIVDRWRKYILNLHKGDVIYLTSIDDFFIANNRAKPLDTIRTFTSVLTMILFDENFNYLCTYFTGSRSNSVPFSDFLYRPEDLHSIERAHSTPETYLMDYYQKLNDGAVSHTN